MCAYPLGSSASLLFSPSSRKKKKNSRNKFSDATPFPLMGIVIFQCTSKLFQFVGPRCTQRPLQTIYSPSLTLHLQFEMVPSNEVRSPCKLCSQGEQPGLSEQSWNMDNDRQDNFAFTLNIFLLTNARISGFEEKHIFYYYIPPPTLIWGPCNVMWDNDTAASAQIMVRDPTHAFRPTCAISVEGCGALDLLGIWLLWLE